MAHIILRWQRRMVLESSTSNEIHYIQFNDEASLNAIASTDWKSIIDEVEKFEKSECKYLVLKCKTLWVQSLLIFSKAMKAQPMLWLTWKRPM